MKHLKLYKNIVGKISIMFCVVMLFIISSISLTETHAQTKETKIKVDRNRLEIIEELSESLANDLLQLSVATRDRDLEAMQSFFPQQINAKPFPSTPLSVKKDKKWIGLHSWKTAQKVAVNQKVSLAKNAISSKLFINSFNDFLGHFSSIEDSRFKVKEATFEDDAKAVLGAEQPTAIPGAKGKARIAFYVIGRNTDGKREWAKGSFWADVRADKSKLWQFDSIKLIDLNSMVADTDIFSEVADAAGVGVNVPAFGTAENNGFVWHGAAAADFNNDNWMDLFVIGTNRNYLYLNDKKGGFKDISGEAGVEILASGTAPLVFDFDNDGDKDIFISAVGQQILLENLLSETGSPEFIDISLEAGVAKESIGFSAVAGDVNGDGRLDVYVTSYNRYGQITPNSWFRATNGTPNLLFISQANGTFKEEAQKWGVDDRRWSYAAEFADINADGKIDLYVANDFGEKAFYINKGNKFVDEAKERGVLDPGNGMGVSFGDYNNDGLLDLHATNMSSTAGNRILSRLFPNAVASDNVLKKLAAGNNLYKNTGDGKFVDVTEKVGGFSGGWAWGGGFIDFDNDGWEDIYTPNGFISGKSMKDT